MIVDEAGGCGDWAVDSKVASTHGKGFGSFLPLEVSIGVESNTGGRVAEMVVPLWAGCGGGGAYVERWYPQGTPLRTGGGCFGAYQKL